MKERKMPTKKRKNSRCITSIYAHILASRRAVLYIIITQYHHSPQLFHALTHLFVWTFVGLAASLGYVFHSDSAFSSLLPRALFAVRFSYTRPSALQSCLGTAIEPPVLILIILQSHSVPAPTHTLTLWVVLRLLFFVSVFIFASLTHSLTFSAVILDRGSVC